MMDTIREMFHEVGNWHNKISMGAGVAKATLKNRFKNNSAPKEITEVFRSLTTLEQHAVSAGRTLNKLKDIIYGIVDPDTLDKTKNKGGQIKT